jgi:hypothetical protein
VKILKGAEKNQVKWNVFRRTVVSIFGLLQWTQSTLKEKLQTYNPHAVWVRNGRYNVVIITMIADVVLIGENSSQTIL